MTTLHLWVPDPLSEAFKVPEQIQIKDIQEGTFVDRIKTYTYQAYVFELSDYQSEDHQSEDFKQLIDLYLQLVSEADPQLDYRFFYYVNDVSVEVFRSEPKPEDHK